MKELSGIDDLEQCKSILGRHNWDVETAIHDHLGLDPRETTEPQRESPQLPQQNGNTAIHRPLRGSMAGQSDNSVFQRMMTFFFNPFLDNNLGVWPIPNQRPHGFTGWLLFFSTLPLRIVVGAFYQFTSFVLKIIRPDNRPGENGNLIICLV